MIIHKLKIILIVGMGTTLGMAVLALLLGVAVQVFHHYHHHHKLNLYIIVSLSQTHLFTHFRQWHSPAKACKSFFFLWFSDSCLASCSFVLLLVIQEKTLSSVTRKLFHLNFSGVVAPVTWVPMSSVRCVQQTAILDSQRSFQSLVKSA